MPTGIRQGLHLNNIVTAMKNVETNWTALSAQQRCQQIADTVTTALQAVFVPVPQIIVGNLPAGINGKFSRGPWSITINVGMAIGRIGQTANQRKEIIAQLGDLITHEARHCEQYYKIARLVLGDRRRKGLMTTANELGGPNGILGVFSLNAIQRALAAPPLNPVEEQETRPWYTSIYGKGASFRNINLLGRQLRPTGGRFAHVGQQYQQTEFMRYQRGLSEEEDAHQTGREIQRLFLLGSGIPPQPLLGHAPVAQGISAY